jgi:hypothetical protein
MKLTPIPYKNNINYYYDPKSYCRNIAQLKECLTLYTVQSIYATIANKKYVGVSDIDIR